MAGADDYIVKPFSFPVLLARVKAVLSRFEAEDLEDYFQPVYEHGDLLIDVESCRVAVREAEVILATSVGQTGERTILILMLFNIYSLPHDCW